MATNSDDEVRVEKPKTSVAGIRAIRHALQYAAVEMGVTRGVKTLLAMNQTSGFDCPGCAWPDSKAGDRSHAEFCENGAKATSWEATRDRAGREFFAAHSVSELLEEDGHSLEHHGRLTEPMYLAPGEDHYAPITWDEAFELIADRLRALPDPNRAAFYTSGRASNEAAFVYQLLARRLGTNNLPDCSNMCHESTGTALSATIGVGKGVVTLEDITDHAELIVIIGQNPGTNHPRMLTALEMAKKRGARIVSANPLPEAGLLGFKNPQTARGLVGGGTKLSDRYLAVRVNGDLAMFSGVNKALLALEEKAPGTIFDHFFIETYCDRFEEACQGWRELEWPAIEEASGLTRKEIEAFAGDVVAAKSVIVCWAMGITCLLYTSPSPR